MNHRRVMILPSCVYMIFWSHQHYMDQCSSCLDLCRYCRDAKAKPLWPMSSGRPSNAEIPKCSYCGGPMSFEFQVLYSFIPSCPHVSSCCHYHLYDCVKPIAHFFEFLIIILLDPSSNKWIYFLSVSAGLASAALLLWSQKWCGLSRLGHNCRLHLYGFLWSKCELHRGIRLGSVILFIAYMISWQ